MKAMTGVIRIACMLMIAPVWAATIYVDDCSSPGDGSSSSTPLCSIEAGASVASPGDTITVLPGTYRECFELSKPGLQLLAEDFETNEKNDTTVIDGRGVCDNSSAPEGSGSVITLAGGALVRGFTIRGGGRSAVSGVGSFTLAHNVIDAGAGEYGGGVRAIVDSVQGGAGPIVIEENTVKNSSASKDGGAIFVLARPAAGASAAVEVRNNVVKSNVAATLGAGIAVLSDSPVGGTVFVAVTGNTVEGNRVLGTATGAPGFGGGIWASTNGEGHEVVHIVDNNLASNIASGAGGGVSVWMRARGEAAHTILVEQNTLTSNRALGDGGGGLDLYLSATDLPSTAVLDLTTRSNYLSSNVAEAGDGGGILATALVARTSTSGIRFDVESNTLQANLAVNGAGAALVALAEDPGPPSASAAVAFSHNLVVFNRASQGVPDSPSGAGVDILARAVGASTTRLTLDSNTFASNSIPYASGGISVVTQTSVDPAGTGEGTAWVTIANSIISNNEGFGIGGEIRGSPEHTNLSVSYNDVYGNSGGAYQASIGTPPPESGNIESDPLLDADWAPSACSPTTDAADPAADFSLEPQPNGDRANQGHLGGTSAARRTLADINADRLVDGVEVIAIASSFGATQGQPRYNEAADVNKDGTVEGEDLSIVGSDFGVDCRP